MSIRITGMVSGMDTDTMVKELVNVQKLKNKRVSDQKTLLTWKQDKWKELNTKLYKLYTTELSNLKTRSNYMTKSVSVSNDTLLSASANINAPIGAHSIEVKQLASAQYVTSNKVDITGDTKLVDISSGEGENVLKIEENNVFYFGELEYTVTADSTVNDLVSKIKEAGLNANFDQTNKRFFLSSKESGVGFQIRAKNAIADDTDNSDLLKLLGLSEIKKVGEEFVSSGNGDPNAVIVPASMSELMYNGVKLESTSNVVTVNGLTLNLKGSKIGEEITLTVSNDAQATYDTIKNFIKSYNSVLDEMNKLYNAGSARGYDPLSDEEREAMTEDQIEKWETKIKDSLLRKDSTVGSLITSMRSVINESVTVKVGDENKAFSLSTYGIMTSSNYLEKGLLHIYGDTEDPTYALNDDKLLKAIKDDPDTVLKVFTEIGNKLYEDMSKKMKSVPNISSALTFYNDKLMDKQQTEYDKEITKLEERLLALEDKYYKQFSAMETALNKLQQQSSSLLSMLGTSGNY